MVGYVIGRNKWGLGWYLFENEDGLVVNYIGFVGYVFVYLMVFFKDKVVIMLLINFFNGRVLVENVGYNFFEDFGLVIVDVFLF